ncbi:MAG: Mur ligase family protein [Candidatus Nealsonbacteria bacterium]
MIYFLSFFWFLRQIKANLFWLYLWQLKEYHIGRFIDHFRTYKGKRLFLNNLMFVKLFLLFLAYDCPVCWSFLLVPLVLITYLLESSKFGYNVIFKKNLIKPVLTKKTIFLIIVSFIFVFCWYFFLFNPDLKSFVFYLLLFDVLTPFVISGIVLVFQPFVVLMRNQVIAKAKKKRAKFKNLIVIGITGSYGKTSCKEFLYEVLKTKYNVLKTEKNQNSEIGISQCVLNDLKPEHEVFIVEMGAYGRGGIKLLCDIVQPKIGVLTGINEQHMALFGSQDNITKTKFELIESLPKTGLAILNGNNDIVRNLKPQTDKFVFCSTKEELGFWAKNIVLEKESVNFRANSRDEDSAQFKINVLGVENIENILLVSAVAKELGMSLEEVARACENIKTVNTKLFKDVNGVDIIDSTYSANPNGVFSHLNHLKLWSGKKVVVMHCLIELGSASSEIHRKIGEKIAQTCDLAIITTADRFNDIKKGGGDKIVFIEKPSLIFEKIKPFLNSENVVLLEGRISKEIKDLIYGN